MFPWVLRVIGQTLFKYSEWSKIDISNKNLVSLITEKVDLQCAIIASNQNVRGYANMLFHHGIFENKSFKQTTKLRLEKKACASVYLESIEAFPDLQQYNRAIITFNNGINLEVKND